MILEDYPPRFTFVTTLNPVLAMGSACPQPGLTACHAAKQLRSCAPLMISVFPSSLTVTYVVRVSVPASE